MEVFRRICLVILLKHQTKKTPDFLRSDVFSAYLCRIGLLLHCLGGSDGDCDGRADHGVIAHAKLISTENFSGSNSIKIVEKNLISQQYYTSSFFFFHSTWTKCGRKPLLTVHILAYIRAIFKFLHFSKSPFQVPSLAVELNCVCLGFILPRSSFPSPYAAVLRSLYMC